MPQVLRSQGWVPESCWPGGRRGTAVARRELTVAQDVGSRDPSGTHILEQTEFSFGINVPHFGQPTPGQLRESFEIAEGLGFSAIWVRDHLATRVKTDNVVDGSSFVDGMVTLAAAAATTNRIGLGFAAMTLHRHPLNAAAMLAAIDWLGGPERLIVGMGLGASVEEAKAVGMQDWDRRDVVAEYVDVLRLAFDGATQYRGEFYEFDHLATTPYPQHPIWISYCGSSRAAVRRATEYCDSWGPAKLPCWLFMEYVAHGNRLLAQQSGAGELFAMASSAVVLTGKTTATASDTLQHRLESAARVFPNPPSGEYSTEADLDGMYLHGDPEYVASQVGRYLDAGARHFMFDVREDMGNWQEIATRIATEVVPLVEGNVGGGAKG